MLFALFALFPTHFGTINRTSKQNMFFQYPIHLLGRQLHCMGTIFITSAHYVRVALSVCLGSWSHESERPQCRSESETPFTYKNHLDNNISYATSLACRKLGRHHDQEVGSSILPVAPLGVMQSVHNYTHVSGCQYLRRSLDSRSDLSRRKRTLIASSTFDVLHALYPE
jgi:hypothetical protein